MSSVAKRRLIRGHVNLYTWEGTSRKHAVLYLFGAWVDLW
jgi:hypothetical protein